MRHIGLTLCIVGMLTTAEAGIAFTMNYTGWSISGIVLGMGIGATGTMIFLTDLMTWMLLRSKSYVVHSDLFQLRFELHGEIEAVQQRESC
jgi:hypothetical protein